VGNSNEGNPGTGVARRWASGLKSLFGSVRLQRRPRSLRVLESLALGEKRSIIVVGFEDRRYVLGICASSIALLDQLDGTNFTGDAGNSGTALHSDFGAYLPQ